MASRPINVSASLSYLGEMRMTRAAAKSVSQITADAMGTITTYNGDLALSLGLEANGWFFAKNISENGVSVEIGPEIGSGGSAAILPVVSLRPGESTIFRIDKDATVRVSAVFGKLYWLALDD